MAGKNTYDSVIREVLNSTQPKYASGVDDDTDDDVNAPTAILPPTTARVPPDSTTDIGPMIMGHWLYQTVPPQVSEKLSPEEEQERYRKMVEFYGPVSKAVAPPPEYFDTVYKDADVMQQAIRRRQKLGRSE